MSAFGYEWVLQTMEKQPKRTSATLKRRTTADTFADVAYAAVYVHPVDEESPLGRGGATPQRARITAYRMGESYAPRAGYNWLIGGITYQILSVTSRLNGDEAGGYAVYDTDCSRMA